MSVSKPNDSITGIKALTINMGVPGLGKSYVLVHRCNQF